MLTTTTAQKNRQPELLWVGSGAWVACDPAVVDGGPNRVLAYLESKDDRVYLLWVSEPDGVHEFGSIRAAVEAVTRRLQHLPA